MREPRLAAELHPAGRCPCTHPARPARAGILAPRCETAPSAAGCRRSCRLSSAFIHRLQQTNDSSCYPSHPLAAWFSLCSPSRLLCALSQLSTDLVCTSLLVRSRFAGRGQNGAQNLAIGRSAGHGWAAATAAVLCAANMGGRPLHTASCNHQRVVPTLPGRQGPPAELPFPRARGLPRRLATDQQLNHITATRLQWSTRRAAACPLKGCRSARACGTSCSVPASAPQRSWQPWQGPWSWPQVGLSRRRVLPPAGLPAAAPKFDARPCCCRCHSCTEAQLTHEEALLALKLAAPAGGGGAAGAAVALSARQIFEREAAAKRIITFAAELDGILGGGVETGAITEFWWVLRAAVAAALCSARGLQSPAMLPAPTCLPLPPLSLLPLFLPAITTPPRPAPPCPCPCRARCAPLPPQRRAGRWQDAAGHAAGAGCAAASGLWRHRGISSLH